MRFWHALVFCLHRCSSSDFNSDILRRVRLIHRCISSKMLRFDMKLANICWKPVNHTNRLLGHKHTALCINIKIKPEHTEKIECVVLSLSQLMANGLPKYTLRLVMPTNQRLYPSYKHSKHTTSRITLALPFSWPECLA